MVSGQPFTFEEFEEILNRSLFVEERKALIERLIKHPERFTGLFRPSTPEEKILQNIIQSKEIKFGDAFEKIIDQILRKSGYTPLEKELGGELKCDHLFESPDGQRILLIEQKMRNDHDSTKRVGQFSNFEKKIRYVLNKIININHSYLYAIMYFVDPKQRKNMKYYQEQSKQLTTYFTSIKNINIKIEILYGNELFEFLSGVSSICISWDTLISWLQQWKSQLSRGQLIQVNWETEDILSEMKALARENPAIFSKLTEQRILWEEGVIRALFPTGSGLEAICEELNSIQNPRSRKVAEQLRKSIEKYYSSSEESG